MVVKWQRELASQLDARFSAFETEVTSLPGLTPEHRESLIFQIVSSSRATWYVRHLCSSSLSPQAADPQDTYWFNPLKAAIIHHRQDNDDEAYWLIFLLTHFGKHRHGQWKYVREIYGASGSEDTWTWQRVAADVSGFRDWLDSYRGHIVDRQVHQGFGNHRKYESLAGWTRNGSGNVVASYVAWVGHPPVHHLRFDNATSQAGGVAESAFDILYRSMRSVHRFGRLARFDYLAMVGKIGLANIMPGKAYLSGSTGPLKAARLLFQSPDQPGLSVTELENATITLGTYLEVSYDVIEDALCNWQKSPLEFRRFRG